MSGKQIAELKGLKSYPEGTRVTFRARAVRFWEVGGLRMCLAGDESALTRIEVGLASVQQGKSYEFRNAVVRAYPGGWHSAVLDEMSEAVPLGVEVPLSQDEVYIERTYKILAGVQRKKGRAAGRLPPWRHPAEGRVDEP